MKRLLYKSSTDQFFIFIYSLFLIFISYFSIKNLILILDKTCDWFNIFNSFLYFTFIILYILQIIFFKNKNIFRIFARLTIFPLVLNCLYILIVSSNYNSESTLILLLTIVLLFISNFKRKIKLVLIITIFVLYSIIISIKLLKILNIEIYDIKNDYLEIINIFIIFIIILSIYILIQHKSMVLLKYFKKKFHEEKNRQLKLKTTIKRYKQNLKTWNTIDNGIINNLDKLTKEKEDFFNNLNQLYNSKKGIEQIKKFNVAFDKHLEILYSFVNRSVYAMIDNTDDLTLAVDSNKLFVIIFEQSKTNLNLKTRIMNKKIRINVDKVQYFIEKLINILSRLIRKDDLNNPIYFYFSSPVKENIYNYTLNCLIENGSLYSIKLKMLMNEDKELKDFMKVNKYKIYFENVKNMDLKFNIKIPKLVNRDKGLFKTDYKLRLSGNKKVGGILRITKDKTEFKLELTRTEYELIFILMKKLISDILNNDIDYNLFGYLEKYDIVENIFGELSEHGNRLSAHLYRMRSKLQNFGLNPDLFQSKHKSLRISTSASLKDIIIE